MRYLKAYKLFENITDDFLNDIDDIIVEIEDQGLFISRYKTTEDDEKITPRINLQISRSQSGNIHNALLRGKFEITQEISDSLIRLSNYVTRLGWAFCTYEVHVSHDEWYQMSGSDIQSYIGTEVWYIDVIITDYRGPDYYKLRYGTNESVDDIRIREMRYLKAYESMKEDFYKEMEALRKRENEIIQSTKEDVDDHMFSLTDDYSDTPSIINVYRRLPNGEVEKKNITVVRYNWNGEDDLVKWYHRSMYDSKEVIVVESSFSITYKLSCPYSEDGGYRLYDKEDKLDNLIDELESTIKRIKDTTGLEYRIKTQSLVKGTEHFHQSNFGGWIDMNYLRAELAMTKEVNIYQNDKFGKPNNSPYELVEIIVEFL
jgi:hypothetical protein